MATNSSVSRAVRAARRELEQVDPGDPTQALPLLREAVEQLTTAIDESMAAAVIDEESTLRAAGTLAGLSENAVGPRLARTDRLAPYASDGRVTAKGVERALYDKEFGRTPAAAAPQQPPLRFKPRRNKPS